MLVVLLSSVWGWRTVMLKLSGFYCNVDIDTKIKPNTHTTVWETAEKISRFGGRCEHDMQDPC